MEHSPERRQRLHDAGMSEGSELTPEQIKRLDDASPTMKGDRLRSHILSGSASKPNGKAKAKPRASAGAEAVKLLAERGPMHYRDLASALIQAGLVKPKGKTFAQTLSADLTRRMKRGEVERVEPGVYKAVT